MVVLIIDEDNILAFKPKREPPVAAYRHCPMALEIAMQRMQIVTRRVHIAGSAGNVKRGQEPPEPVRMLGLNARLRAVLGELFQPPVLVVLNHPYSV